MEGRPIGSTAVTAVQTPSTGEPFAARHSSS